jgi:hypothetical protein
MRTFNVPIFGPTIGVLSTLERLSWRAYAPKCLPGASKRLKCSARLLEERNRER